MAASAVAGQPPGNGAVLLGVAHQYNNDWAIVDLRNGATKLLPYSATTSHGRGWDAWTATTSTRELVRVSSRGAVDFLDRDSLQRHAGFSLADLPGTHAPEIFGAVRVSPDGRYLLAYWKASSRQDQPEIVVFDRQGHIVQNGSPFRYDVMRNRYAIDWLPDSRRYVYLAGNNIVVREIGSDKVLHLPLQLPRNVGTGMASIAVSPDGTRMAMTLAADLRNGKGGVSPYNLLFVSALDGSGLRPLSRPSDRVLSQAISMGHGSPSWSADGRSLIFTQRDAVPYGALTSVSPCTKVMVLPVDSATRAIDGANDPPDIVLRAGNAPVISCETVQWLAP
ncbi:TolB family protein [Scleromatobacter humisilvae]|uniref:Protein TolB n=1 Tax=Scleromatobacter humisilvae TaxID=2897159 RepID=A0A9X1YMX1_9BURK|nr:hypothetical protein [Scleromatobacter humisilvae]MCK9689514.1 hypothetical protein [Scleromatobacter humisilvae]